MNKEYTKIYIHIVYYFLKLRLLAKKKEYKTQKINISKSNLDFIRKRTYSF